MSIRGQGTEDRGQIFVRAPRGLLNRRGKAATNHLSSVFCLPSSDRGFTLIELIIVIIIIVTLMGLFMNRVMFYQEQAEKVAMEGVAGAIQSALILQYGQILTRGKPSDVAALTQDNPMNWLQRKPRNYAGEFYEPTPLSVESGNWVFDLKTRDLVYLVRNAGHFKPGRGEKKRGRRIFFFCPLQGGTRRAPSRDRHR